MFELNACWCLWK